MWFRYDDTNPLNFARQWQRWELEYPCPIEDRRWWPAFSPTGDAVPFTGSKAEACLNVLLAVVMTTAEAAKRSWHSARITIATRLFARRGSVNGIARDDVEGVIQSLVRWKTPEAMRIYARMERDQYADYVDMATDANMSPSVEMPEDLCEVDPRGVLRETEATAAALEAEAAAAVKAARAAGRAGGAAGAADAHAGKKQRRANPTSGNIAANASVPAATQLAFDIGDGQVVQHAGAESWGVIGQRINVHHTFWNIDVDDYTPGRVVGYVGRFSFPDGSLSKHTYIMECEGNHYPIRHNTVANALEDAGTRRRVKAARPPRLL